MNCLHASTSTFCCFKESMMALNSLKRLNQAVTVVAMLVACLSLLTSCSYIFGENEKQGHGLSGNEQVAMTSPVRMEMKQSEKVAMTSPVRMELKIRPEEGSSVKGTGSENIEMTAPVQMDIGRTSKEAAHAGDGNDVSEEYTCADHLMI
jgi:hypothetical protein